MSQLSQIYSMLSRIELENKEVFTVAEAARFMGVEEKTMNGYLSKKLISYSKPKKERYIKRSDCVEFMLRNPVKSKHSIEAEAESVEFFGRKKQLRRVS